MPPSVSAKEQHEKLHIYKPINVKPYTKHLDGWFTVLYFFSSDALLFAGVKVKELELYRKGG